MKARTASLIELSEPYSRAKTSGARTKLFLTHCRGRNSRSSSLIDILIGAAPPPPAFLTADCGIVADANNSQSSLMSLAVLYAVIALVATAANIAAQELRSEEHTSELQSHSDLVCRL